MSGKICLLPETLTHRIAAGEVVERPASILKELLENALDAGATEIVVALERGGCASIRVTDNGEGIAPEEVPLAFSRYATSKIGAFEDIYTVRTFGFRGEALPSIASIAEVEMVTRQAAAPAGTRIVIKAGEVMELSEAGCPVGTSLFVSRIFDSVPVRKKFLKNDLTEQGACIDALTRLALARPEVTLRASAGGRIVLNLPGVTELAERIALTLGKDFRGQLVPAEGSKEGVRLRGFVSRPDFTRSSAAQMYLYVNGRFVKDYLLNHAVMTAYRRVIASRRYPAVVLALELPIGDVDVNVHPAKLEVRFRNPREIYGLIVETLNRAIGADAKPGAAAAGLGMQGRGATAYGERVEEALKRYRVSTGSEKLFFTGPVAAKRDVPPAAPASFTPEPIAAPAEPPPEEIPEKCARETIPAEEGRGLAERRYLGHAAGTYLIFADAEGVLLVDQHAAHERIIYERLRRRAAGERIAGQRLLLPEVISLPPRDFSFLAESLPILAEAGLEVEPFGGDSLVVKAVPTFLSHAEARTLILDLLADCTEADRRLALTDRRERIFTALACRGAVKANRELSAAEVTALCRELDAIPQAATCPHGRPLCLFFSIAELEKLFKRR
ncbi:MAG: DNA mismatch repair endonuclease MutL [Deltaproteobacteria bacterium]|nr:DNA mismatch repair endonuclease MutL [Deltaproteobacteria bacterium]